MSKSDFSKALYPVDSSGSSVWYELFVITATGMGFALFLVYLLAARVPTKEEWPTLIGIALADMAKEFGLAPPPAGGRPPEGMLDRVLAIPGVQDLITGWLKGIQGGSGLPGSYVRR